MINRKMNISVTLNWESYEKYKSKVAWFALQLKDNWEESLLGNLNISLHEYALTAINQPITVDLNLENCVLSGGAKV